jgi:hypothetical protein
VVNLPVEDRETLERLAAQNLRKMTAQLIALIRDAINRAGSLRPAVIAPIQSPP